MKTQDSEEIRQAVREGYGRIAEGGSSCCGPSSQPGGCCTPGDTTTQNVSKRLGYTDEDMQSVPEGANMGLGCGNPQAIASLKKGETVLDLGSGGGFDCFQAAKQVGLDGRVIGVDMTPEMNAKARKNAQEAGMANVEFRLGEIENLPVADNSVDVILSNCVINLSPEKLKVYQEAFRVLKPGGRLAISDIVATAKLPKEARQDLAQWSGCMSGAEHIPELERILHVAGFQNVRVRPKSESHEFIREWSPERKIADYIVSATIEGVKPIHRLASK